MRPAPGTGGPNARRLTAASTAAARQPRGMTVVPALAEPPPRRLAVALHDVEPSTFERCALIRDWLDDLGIDRVTLLVIPATGLHPFSDRCPDLVPWLHERARLGDAIAQHGLTHRQTRPASPGRHALARWQGGPAAEFCGLDPEETRHAVTTGRRLLERVGLRIRGFVPPAYAQTPALRAELSGSFDWWASLSRVHRYRGDAVGGIALGLGTSSAGKRALSPWLLPHAAHARRHAPVLRLDLHPADFDHRAHVRAVERTLAQAVGRAAVSYDDLARG